MTDVLIGDVQGCAETLHALISKCQAELGTCNFIFLGDLVNRGPASLQVMELMMQGRYRSVLGNHEIYVLAVHAGIMKRRKDTLGDLWTASDLAKIVDWLRHLPIVIEHDAGVLVHAGVHPTWTFDELRRYASAIQAGLQSENWQTFLGGLFSNEASFSDLRRALDICTRMRCLTHANELDFSFKGPPEQRPSDLVPWYSRYDGRLGTIFFGHWAALGARQFSSAVCLDSGCVWGRHLSAFVPTERRFIQQVALD